MQAEHPFQIPSHIDAVQNDQAAVPALGSLHNLIRSLFVEDRSQIYWIFVMGMVAFVFLSTIVNWILLICCLFKKRFTLMNLYKIPKCKYQIGFPNSTGFTVFTASVSAIWFIIFAVHQFRLDQQLDSNELYSSMLWLCMLCLPFWFTLYVQSIEFMDLPLLRAKTGYLMKNNKVIEIILRITLCILAVAFPFFATLISVTSGYGNQQDYNDVVAEVMRYFTDSDLSQDGFQLTGSAAGATKILRRYEEEAISIWKALSNIFYNAEGVMMGWACSFGMILAFYLVGAVKLYLAHRRSKKALSNTPINTVKTDQDVESTNFDSATLIDENTEKGYPDYQFLQKYKHTLSVMCCIIFLIINSFLADRLSHLVEMAQITQFIGHYLGVLSMMALFASAYSITHLSIIYANDFQPFINPSVSNPVSQSKHDTETGSVDTDATLTP